MAARQRLSVVVSHAVACPATSVERLAIVSTFCAEWGSQAPCFERLAAYLTEDVVWFDEKAAQQSGIAEVTRSLDRKLGAPSGFKVIHQAAVGDVIVAEVIGQNALPSTYIFRLRQGRICECRQIAGLCAHQARRDFIGQQHISPQW